MRGNMNRIFLILVALCLATITSTPSLASELEITNLSNIEIYPTVISGKSEERFGVVAIGKSKTVGFTPFRLGDKMEISWEEQESYNLTKVIIDSKQLKKLQKTVESIHLIYNGNRNWVLKAFDNKDRQIGSIP